MVKRKQPIRKYCRYFQQMRTFRLSEPGYLIDPQDLDVLSVLVNPLLCVSEEIMEYQNYAISWIKFQKVISNPMCGSDFVPEAGSEIFVKNLPSQFCEVELFNFFKKAGMIFKIRIMMDETLTKNRGFCYVTYMDSFTAKRALSDLHLTEFQSGVYLSLEGSLNNCRIFVGGIPTHKSKNEVWQELHNQGVKNIVDVIMYRSYNERSENRGYVFVEFQTHEQAAHFRARNLNCLELWGSRVIIDWSVPLPSVDETVLEKVRIIYLRNLDVLQTPEELETIVLHFTNKSNVEKIYKFKNYAFVHLSTRKLAEQMIYSLKGYFKDTPVEITWAKPATKYTTQEYRQLKIRNLSTKSRSRNNSSSSTSSALDDFSFGKSSPQGSSYSRERYSSSGSGSCQFQDWSLKSSDSSPLSTPSTSSAECSSNFIFPSPSNREEKSGPSIPISYETVNRDGPLYYGGARDHDNPHMYIVNRAIPYGQVYNKWTPISSEELNKTSPPTYRHVVTGCRNTSVHSCRLTSRIELANASDYRNFCCSPPTSSSTPKSSSGTPSPLHRINSMPLSYEINSPPLSSEIGTAQASLGLNSTNINIANKFGPHCRNADSSFVRESMILEDPFDPIREYQKLMSNLYGTYREVLDESLLKCRTCSGSLKTSQS